MREAYKDAILAHPLKREIIATMVTNSIVNRAGMTFFFQIQEDTALPACDVARGYTIARDLFTLRDLWNDLEKLEGTYAAAAQAAMVTQMGIFLDRVVNWLLRTLPQPLNIAECMARFGPAINDYLDICDGLMPTALKRAFEEKKQRFIELGAPKDLATRIARLEVAASGLDVTKLALENTLPVPYVGETYFAVGADLKLGYLRRQASRMKPTSYWERLAAKSLVAELFDEQRRITATVLTLRDTDESPKKAIEDWHALHAKTVKRYHAFTQDLKASEAITFPMLVIALRNVKAIASL